MPWKFNPLNACHELHQADGSIAARIYQAERADRAHPFRAKTLVSGLCYSERRLAALIAHGKEWVANRRDFDTEADRTTYIDARKLAIEKFVARRHAGK